MFLVTGVKHRYFQLRIGTKDFSRENVCSQTCSPLYKRGSLKLEINHLVRFNPIRLHHIIIIFKISKWFRNIWWISISVSQVSTDLLSLKKLSVNNFYFSVHKLLLYNESNLCTCGDTDGALALIVWTTKLYNAQFVFKSFHCQHCERSAGGCELSVWLCVVLCNSGASCNLSRAGSAATHRTRHMWQLPECRGTPFRILCTS